MIQKCGEEMTFEVVDPDEGNLPRQGERFRLCDTDEE